MAEVLFYHLTSRPLEQALPELLGRCLERQWRAVVKCASAGRAEELCEQLWTFRREAFLPHGTRADGHPDLQPVFLTHQDERPNNAEVLFLVDGSDTGMHADFQRVCDIFDGQDEAAVEAARNRWKAAKAGGHKLTYWQQGERSWEKKAEA